MAVPIVEEFIELAEIDTVSRQERAMVDALKGSWRPWAVPSGRTTPRPRWTAPPEI